MRDAALAGTGWYPGDRADCEREVERLLAEAPRVDVEGPLIGGVVPHAGWSFSGPTAATVFRALSEAGPWDAIVVLGAVHRARREWAAVSTEDAWETPLGPLAIAGALRAEILDLGPELVAADESAHPPGENSIELQTALIRALLPGLPFLPVTVPPGSVAVPFGRALGRALAARDGRVAVVASTDLTHYGYGGWSPAGRGPEAVRWVREVNDRRFLDLVRELRAEAIVPEAHERLNACGAGAVAAAVAAARETGAREGIVLHQTTSAEVRPGLGDDSFVGYAGVVFR
jgi:AmmeMemoRadiSam system protein B